MLTATLFLTVPRLCRLSSLRSALPTRLNDMRDVDVDLSVDSFLTYLKRGMALRHPSGTEKILYVVML